MRVNGAAGGGGGGERNAKGLLTSMQQNTFVVGSCHCPVSWLVLLSSSGTALVNQCRADFRDEVGKGLEITDLWGR